MDDKLALSFNFIMTPLKPQLAGGPSELQIFLTSRLNLGSVII